MSIATTLMSRGGRSHPWCKVRRWWRDDRVRRVIDENLRGGMFRRHMMVPQGSAPNPASANPKDATVPFVPVALLDAALAEMIGARDRILRLTDPVADKQYWRHGPGLLDTAKRKKDIRRNTTPVEWYADIQDAVREVKPIRSEKGRWLFDFEKDGKRRRLVVDINERGNPAVISYHPR